MKTLYIMRHGKAEEGANKADYKRKLISKGMKRNQKVGELLLDKKANFEALLCSNATRTLETAIILADIFKFPTSKIQQAKELYLAPAGMMLQFIYALDNDLSSALLVAHNPGISELATSLSGRLVDWMPTSNLIALEIDTDKWEEINTAPTKITFSLSGKE